MSTTSYKLIENALNKMCQSEDDVLMNMAFNMKFNFGKYWRSVDRINLFVYIAFLNKPQYKIYVLRILVENVQGN